MEGCELFERLVEFESYCNAQGRTDDEIRTEAARLLNMSLYHQEASEAQLAFRRIVRLIGKQCLVPALPH
jgi:hypothetical protein